MVYSGPGQRAALAIALDALVPQQRARGPQGSHTAALPASDPQTLEMTDSLQPERGAPHSPREKVQSAPLPGEEKPTQKAWLAKEQGLGAPANQPLCPAHSRTARRPRGTDVGWEAWAGAPPVPLRFTPGWCPWPVQQEPSPLSVTGPCPTEVTTTTTTDDVQGLWRQQPGTDASSGKSQRLARDDLARNPPGHRPERHRAGSATKSSSAASSKSPAPSQSRGKSSLCPQGRPHPIFTTGQTVTWEGLHLPAHRWPGCCQPQGQKAISTKGL